MNRNYWERVYFCKGELQLIDMLEFFEGISKHVDRGDHVSVTT